MWFRNIFNRSKSSPVNQPLDSVIPALKTAVQLNPSSFSQLNRLRINASRFITGHRTGLRSSAQRRPHLEFREHRMYAPGDDVRFVDWKASARQEHIFLKQGEHYKEVNIFVLIDSTASMAWGEPPKAALALRLAALLGYLTLNHNDRFFVAPFTQPPLPPLGPIAGKGQMPNLLNYLRTIPFRGEADFLAAGREFRRSFGHTPGLLFVISDFLKLDDPLSLLELFPAPKWDVVFIHLLHPTEINPPAYGDYEFQDVETGQTVNLDIDQKAVTTYAKKLKEWMSTLDMACIEKNAFYLHIPAGEISDFELISLLRANDLLKSQ